MNMKLTLEILLGWFTVSTVLGLLWTTRPRKPAPEE
jgi:hypothetical protein